MKLLLKAIGVAAGIIGALLLLVYLLILGHEHIPYFLPVLTGVAVFSWLTFLVYTELDEM